MFVLFQLFVFLVIYFVLLGSVYFCTHNVGGWAIFWCFMGAVMMLPHKKPEKEDS